MRCEFCQGRGWITRVIEYAAWREMVRMVEYEPCQECHGTCIVSCCEGSERHGQLPASNDVACEVAAGEVENPGRDPVSVAV